MSDAYYWVLGSMRRRLVVGAMELRGKETHLIDQWKPVAAVVFEQLG